ncbi:MAG: hypothetical protein VKI63_07395 [Cyanobium sp.]|jgi:hypothetical protein|nr:hypothetical protein [Cyanobium sp.]
MVSFPAPASLLRCAAPVLAAVLSQSLPVLAQSESFLLGPGSKVGPATEVKPKNCVTAPDGSVTCDTELVNPAGDTPAKPQLELFKN